MVLVNVGAVAIAVLFSLLPALAGGPAAPGAGAAVRVSRRSAQADVRESSETATVAVSTRTCARDRGTMLTAENLHKTYRRHAVAGARAQRPEPRSADRRVPEHRRRVRLGQEHAAAPARHARRARTRARSCLDGKRIDNLPGPRPRRAAEPHLRLHLPVLPPAPGTHDARERADAGVDRALGRSAGGRRRRSGGARAEELLERVGLGAPAEAPAARAVRRRDAAGRHRPGAARRTRASCSPTSRPATSTPRPAARSSACSAT